MSRYTIPTLCPQHTCVVGYDPPLGTFFAQVFATNGSRRRMRVVHWVGTDVHEILTVEDLAAAIANYATIPPDIRQQLDTEQRAVGFRPNFGTRLVQWLRHQRQEHVP